VACDWRASDSSAYCYCFVGLWCDTLVRFPLPCVHVSFVYVPCLLFGLLSGLIMVYILVWNELEEVLTFALQIINTK
jgi:hypothetical protein